MVAELKGRQLSGWTIGDPAGPPGKSAIVLQATRGDQQAALKVFDRELVERFGAKVQLARIERSLSLKGQRHPNLVQIIDGGYSDDLKVMFVFMEYWPYPNLANVLSRIPRERISTIVSQIARAAKFLEDRSLVHRDIKPDNVVVSDDFAHAVVLDLGVLRPTQSYDTLSDQDQPVFLATLRYSSPEYLFRVEEDTPEAWRALTFYQIGGVLHDLIMRKRLFEGSDQPYARLVEAVKNEIPQIAATDVPPELVLLAKNCLSKKPELRLRYVKWDDFEPHEGATDTARLRNRIVRRTADARERALAATSAGSLALERDRVAKRALQDLTGRLDRLLRKFCAGIDLLPPFSIHQDVDHSSARSSLLLTFDKEPGFDLPRHLIVLVNVTLQDAATMAADIGALALVAPEHVSPGFDDNPPVVVFRGAFEDAVVEGHLERVLLAAIDEAQRAGDGADTVRLPLKTD